MTEHDCTLRQWEIEQFLYHEARLLDERELSRWLALFTEDARYRVYTAQFIGQGHNRTRPISPTPVLVTDDDRDFLRVRVARLERNLAGCEFPPSLTRHFVSNVTARPLESGELEVSCYFRVFQNRNGEDSITGRRVDRIVRATDGFKIAERSAFLDHLVLPRTMSIFV
jgi:3-phenylpropionate/cinnamic acid dioxygenase small subunit